MNTIDDGGPAFPTAGYEGESTIGKPTEGMTLRDYFAAKADISARLENLTDEEAISLGIPMPDHVTPIHWILWESKMKAKLRYIEADAMIAARKVTP